MAIIFPTSPTNGQIATVSDGRQYKYITATNRWELYGGLSQATETRPPSPRNGEIFFTSGGSMEVWDESAAQWVVTSSGALGSDYLFDQVGVLLDGEGGVTNLGSAGAGIQWGGVSHSTAQSFSGTGSLQFNGGSTAYMEWTAGDKFNLLYGDFTWEAYVRISSAPTTLAGLFFSGDPTNNDYRVQAGIEPGRTVNFYLQEAGGTNSVSCATSTPIPLNTWTHIACTKSGGDLKVFFNGSLENAVNSNFSFGTNGTNGSLFNLGRARASGVLWYFSGFMDNVRLTAHARYTNSFAPETILPTS